MTTHERRHTRGASDPVHWTAVLPDLIRHLTQGAQPVPHQPGNTNPRPDVAEEPRREAAGVDMSPEAVAARQRDALTRMRAANDAWLARHATQRRDRT